MTETAASEKTCCITMRWMLYFCYSRLLLITDLVRYESEGRTFESFRARHFLIFYRFDIRRPWFIGRARSHGR